MPEKPGAISNRVIVIIVVCVVIVGLSVLGLWYWKSRGTTTVTKKPSTKVAVPIETQPVIDYNKLEKDRELKDLMDKRKEEYGVGEGIDSIVKSDESLKIGDSTVSMQKIMDKIQLKIGDIVEKNIAKEAITEDKKEFGIYVVQPGDNIWNVHFEFLKDYFARKEVTLSPRSDEPNSRGYSSGVGKLLKFSENVVYIYNLKKQDLDSDLNLIHPLSKLVIYNMAWIFALLDQIDYDNVDHIEFDGEMLWIPSE